MFRLGFIWVAVGLGLELKLGLGLGLGLALLLVVLVFPACSWSSFPTLFSTPTAPSHSTQPAKRSSRFNQVFTLKEALLLDLLAQYTCRDQSPPREPHTLTSVAHACVRPCWRCVTAGWKQNGLRPSVLKCLLFSMCSHWECSWARERLC